MSFASEPGRDDGNLPPVNVVIPDDARELDRDVLAYRREMRANRRRQRFLRIFQPFRTPEVGGHAAIIPLIAAWPPNSGVRNGWKARRKRCCRRMARISRR